MTREQLESASPGSLWTDSKGVTYRVTEQHTLEVYAPNQPENGVNPLNTLSFDINTLIPFNEFNWDTIDGMDAVHTSIMKSYGSLTQQLAKNIDRASANVNQIDGQITDTLSRAIDKASNTVDAVDDSIVKTLTNQADTLTPAYGTGVGQLQWYIVYHYFPPSDLWPFAELVTQPPADQEWYGPFRDGFIFCLAAGDLAQIIHGHAPGYAGNHDFNQTQLMALYDKYANNYMLTHPNWSPGDGDGSGITAYDLLRGACPMVPGGPPPQPPPPPPPQPPVEPPLQPPTEPPPGCFKITNCPKGVVCIEIGIDPIFGPYYIDERNPGVKVKAIQDDVCPPKPPVEPPVLPPVLPPVVCPPCPPVICPPVVQPPVLPPICPPPVINIPPCPEPKDPDLSKLVNAINELCKCFPSGGQSGGGGSDIEYLYSDAGQERIDTFLDSNGLAKYDSKLPATIGDGLQSLLELSLKES